MDVTLADQVSSDDICWDEGAPAAHSPSSAGWVIGQDLGGTKLRGALASPEGKIVVELEQPTANHAPDSTLDQVAEMARRLAERGGIALAAVDHVAVGIPGVVAPNGRVLSSPNVSFSGDVSPAEQLQELLGRPVGVDNDVNLAAFGELVAGRGRGHAGRSLAFIAIGTGIGMGLIIDGHLLHGSSGAAGEIAFMPFGADPVHSAGANPEGDFEAAVGSEGIRRAYRSLGGDGAGVREIFSRADAGELAAKTVIDQVLRNIAIGLGSVIALLDPGLIVVGGGIGSRPGVAELIGQMTAKLVPMPCDVVPSALGERAGVVGAVAYARAVANARAPMRPGAEGAAP